MLAFAFLYCTNKATTNAAAAAFVYSFFLELKVKD